MIYVQLKKLFKDIQIKTDIPSVIGQVWTATDTEGNGDWRTPGTPIDNVVYVKQASDFDNPSSSTLYIIDGPVNMGTTNIVVPEGGINIEGFGYGVSFLYSSSDNHSLFVDNGTTYSGDINISKCTVYASGLNSQIFNVDNKQNFSSIELNTVNLGAFFAQTPSIGSVSNYRQIRTGNCAVINCADGFTFNGTWAGGFAIKDTILLGNPASFTLINEGANLVFNGSSISDLNASSGSNNSGITVFDLQESNFSSDAGFVLNGARFINGSNPVPRISETSTKAFFKDCVGIKNTRPGFDSEIIVGAVTPLAQGVDTKVLGTTVSNNLTWWSQTNNNEITYDSSLTKDFKITTNFIVDGDSGDEISIIVKKFNFATQSYETLKTKKLAVPTLLTVAYYSFVTRVEFNLNDRIEIFTRNDSDGSDITAEVGSEIFVEVI